ncbi:MAG: Mur ligase family protein [Sphaerochaetaceae bacterium]|nr:Mur ligase family protein [Sphaerochaetaceae bacterium]MDC7238361.1 Mur ligase family protein [Sphaerochaetaceae bacterium]
METTFIDIIHAMENYTNLEKNIEHYTTRYYRLDRMHKLLSFFDNPEKDYQKIHVAGSKGKGSTSKFIATGLKSFGYKVGIYASPHLLDYKERFTVCGDFFSDDFLIEVGNYILDKIKGFTFSDQWGETEPTTFELFTLYGFMLFSKSNCDYAVIETGLGGRLDATNTITPILSVICPIELEHTSILGDTIEKIATEKSKIIKKNIPVVAASLKEEARKVIINEAKAQNSSLRLLENETMSIKSHTKREFEETEITYNDGTKINLKLKLKGSVMAQNAALAILALNTLNFNSPKMISAINETTLLGRFQLLSEKPDLIIDAAHTKISIQALISSIKQIEDKEKCTVIFGSLIDKDHKGIAPILLNNFNNIILSRPGTFKKSDMPSLYNLFKDLSTNSNIEMLLDGNDALQRAFELTPKDGCILVCGSFYLASEIALAFKQLNK